MEVLKLQTWIDMFDPSEINLDKVQEYLEFIKEAMDHYDPDRYSESHHILPRCVDKDHIYDSERAQINGSDHFRAHMKLVECFNGIKKRSMSCALIRMTKGCKSDITPEEWEEARKIYSGSIRGNKNAQGYQHTEEFCKKMSERFSGENHPMYGKQGVMYGKHFTQEHRERISRSLIGKTRAPLSKEHKQKISDSLSGHTVTEEFRKKMSEIRKDYIQQNGYISPMYGKHHSEESRKRMSESAKNRPPISEDTHRKISESSRGRFWITDGIHNRFIRDKDQIPDGWRYGRTIIKKEGVL